MCDVTQDFINRVEEASGGRITFDFFPGEMLGGYPEQNAAVTKGTQDVAYTYPQIADDERW